MIDSIYPLEAIIIQWAFFVSICHIPHAILPFHHNTRHALFDHHYNLLAILALHSMLLHIQHPNVHAAFVVLHQYLDPKYRQHHPNTHPYKYKVACAHIPCNPIPWIHLYLWSSHNKTVISKTWSNKVLGCVLMSFKLLDRSYLIQEHSQIMYNWTDSSILPCEHPIIDLNCLWNCLGDRCHLNSSQQKSLRQDVKK